MAENQRRVWVVEEVPLQRGAVGQRQTEGAVADNDDGTWRWVRPDERLTKDQQEEWDRVVGLLKKVKGEDLRHVICFAGLLDHCMNPKTRDEYSDSSDKPKKGDK